MGQMETTLPLDGRMAVVPLQDGFGLHTLDATARGRFVIDGQRRPGVVLHCFLAGSTDATLDGQDLGLGRPAGTPARLMLTANAGPERFRRTSLPGDYVRKVNISLSGAWLAANGLVVPAGLTRADWALDRTAESRMERLVRLGPQAAPLARLEAASLALGLVADCFGRLGEVPVEPLLAPHDQRRLARMEAFLRDQDGPLPRLDEIAAAGYVSLSTMQRLFRAAHGVSVQTHVRAIRLDRARAALAQDRVPVAEAARIAGYGSAANFATAFRRAFGVTPSEAARGRC